MKRTGSEISEAQMQLLVHNARTCHRGVKATELAACAVNGDRTVSAS